MRQTKLRYTALVVAVAVAGLVAATALVRSRLAEDGSRSAGEGPSSAETAGGGAEQGARLFRDKGCAQCHYTDKAETKIGPGLKGILDRETLSSSGRPATRENVRKQLVDPYDSMPSYADRLDEQEMRLLLDYLELL